VTLRHRPAPVVVVLLLASLGAAGCSSGSPAILPAPATQGAATQASGTAQPGTSSVATTAPTKAPATGTAQVDLLFSGTRAITAKGTTGRCIVITRSDATVAFGFEATEANYPGLGLSFSMANLNGDHVDIKWVIEGNISYGDPGTGITLSADHHSVQLDVELSPFTPQGGTAPGPEHVKGTVTCP
jgi:hypothetical protein